MPSTARVTIAQRDSQQLVTENLDHVFDTQFGRHDTVALAAGIDTTITWPTTGELFVYLTAMGGPTTLSIRPTGATVGWIVNVVTSLRTPILLPKPTNAASFILNAVAALDPVSMVFF